MILTLTLWNMILSQFTDKAEKIFQHKNIFIDKVYGHDSLIFMIWILIPGKTYITYALIKIILCLRGCVRADDTAKITRGYIVYCSSRQYVYMCIYRYLNIVIYQHGFYGNPHGIQDHSNFYSRIPDSKVHGDNMGPIWGRQDPGGPHVGPMNFAIWDAWILNSFASIVYVNEVFRTSSYASCRFGATSV